MERLVSGLEWKANMPPLAFILAYAQVRFFHARSSFWFALEWYSQQQLFFELRKPRAIFALASRTKFVASLP